MKGFQSVTADRDRILVTSMQPHELSVSRFNDCLVFYRRGLGLPLRRQVGERTEFVVEGTPFVLTGLGEESATQSWGPAHLLLLAKDLRRVKESAGAWGGRLVEGPEERESSGGKSRWAVFLDPEGNELEMTQSL